MKKTWIFQVYCYSATKQTALDVCSVTSVKNPHGCTEVSMILPNEV